MPAAAQEAGGATGGESTPGGTGEPNGASSGKEGGEPVPQDSGDDYGSEYSYEYECEPRYVTYNWCSASANSCGAQMLTRTCEENCGGGCGPDSVTSQLGLAQVCIGPTDPTPDAVLRSACSASQCYPAPKTRDVKDASLVPKNVFDATKTKLKLPVNLGWENNVNEWAQLNSNPVGECAVEAYRYEATDITSSVRGEIAERKLLPSPSLDPVLEDVVGQCTLEPSHSYQWRVNACRDLEGTDCTGWSETKIFFTDLAPELLSPFDEDFEDKERAGAVTSPEKPLFLEWCPIHQIGPADVKSYKIEVTLVEGGEEQCHPSGTVKGITCPSFLIDPIQVTTETGRVIEKLETQFQDIRGAFTKGVQYFWSVAACIFESGHECTSFSQKWSFEPVDFPIGKTELADPPNDPSGLGAVGFPVALKWTRPFGINSFQYEISPVTSGKAPKSPDTAKFSPQSKLYSPAELSLNAFYKWRVRACTDIGSKVCEDQGTQEWIFKTTGAAPINLEEKPKDEKGEIVIPATLSWQEVSGAKSYRYQIATDSSFTNIVAGDKDKDRVFAPSAQTSVDYPELRMNKDYWWHVKTCADTGGNVCGAWSSKKQFHTFTLKNPQTLLIPTDGGEFWTYQDTISWEPVPGAKAYYPTLVLRTVSDKDPRCKGLAEEVFLSLTQTVLLKPELKCLGAYDLSMVSCLDTDCKEKSTGATNQWTFQYVQPPPPAFPGLVVCGALSNSDTTPYNERDKCELKHLFLLLRNIIDFALWKLSLIIVVLMAAATGAIMFFSFGGPDLITKVRSIWRSVGIGVLILLFSWLFLNILLGLVGFNVNVFGHWYDLPVP